MNQFGRVPNGTSIHNCDSLGTEEFRTSQSQQELSTIQDQSDNSTLIRWQPVSWLDVHGDN